MSVSTQARLGPNDNGRAMTLDEFRDAEETGGYRYELGGGVLEVTEVPNSAHRRVVGNLYRGVGRYDLDHPGMIETFGGGSEFRLWIDRMSSGRNPDLGIVFEGAAPDQRGRTQPSLVAEVVSKSSRTRDYQVKRREYLAYGIHEYWIIDFHAGLVTVLTRAGNEWAERVFDGDQRIVSDLLPGLELRVSDLWVGVPAEADDDDAV